MWENYFEECAVSLKHFLPRADVYQMFLLPITFRGEIAATVELQEVQPFMSTPGCCSSCLLDCCGPWL